jgi:hypothetical protein
LIDYAGREQAGMRFSFLRDYRGQGIGSREEGTGKVAGSTFLS